VRSGAQVLSTDALRNLACEKGDNKETPDGLGSISLKRKFDQNSFAKSHSTTFTEFILLKAGQRNTAQLSLNKSEKVS